MVIYGAVPCDVPRYMSVEFVGFVKFKELYNNEEKENRQGDIYVLNNLTDHIDR